MSSGLSDSSDSSMNFPQWLQDDAKSAGMTPQNYMTVATSLQSQVGGPTANNRTAVLSAVRQAQTAKAAMGGSTASSGGSTGSNMGQNIDNPNKALIDIGARATNSTAIYNPTPGKADTKTGTSTGKMTTSDGVPAATQDVSYQMPGAFKKADVPMSVPVKSTVPQVQSNAATYPTTYTPPVVTAPSQPATISLGKLPTTAPPPAAPGGTGGTWNTTRPAGWGTSGAFHSPVNTAANTATTNVPTGAATALGNNNMTNLQKGNYLTDQASTNMSNALARGAQARNAIMSIPQAQNAIPGPDDFMYGRYKLPNINLTGGLSQYG